MYPKLEIDNLVIRIPELEEAEKLREFYTDNKSHFEPWEPIRTEEFYSTESCFERIAHYYEYFERRSAVDLYIFAEEERRIIGNCSFTNIIAGPLQACYLGYAIAKDFEGMGIMHKSLIVSIDYMFNELDLHRIMANYMPANKRSERLLHRLGFKKEGYANSYLKIAGKWEDHILTALINPAH